MHHVKRCALFCCFCFCLFASCSRQHLFVRNEYLDHSYLASCKVDTPDPTKCGPFCGQQLIIHWRFPLSYRTSPNLHLLLYVHYRDLTTEEVVIPTKRLWGIYVFRILNDRYWEKGGILTYKVEVRSGEKVLETWTHQVWTELINLDKE